MIIPERCAPMGNCGLCGNLVADPPYGMADGHMLCHTTKRDCYHRWTVWGQRPGKPLLPGMPEKVGAEQA